jgi:hypothetical protein
MCDSRSGFYISHRTRAFCHRAKNVQAKQREAEEARIKAEKEAAAALVQEEHHKALFIQVRLASHLLSRL